MTKKPVQFLAALGVIVAASVVRAQTAYVSNEKDNTISIIDIAAAKVVDTVQVGQRPRGVLLSRDLKQLYICTSDEDHIEVLDLDTLKVTHTLPSGPDPELMALGGDGRLLYVANEDDNMVTVVDVVERRMIKEIPVGVEPEGMGISPDGKWLVNTSETTNMAHFINLATNASRPTYWSMSVPEWPGSRRTATRSGCRRRSAARSALSTWPVIGSSRKLPFKSPASSVRQFNRSA